MLLVDVLAKEIHALDAALKCEQRLVSQYGEDIEKVIGERESYKSQVQSLENIIKEGRAANEKQSKHIAELCGRLDTFSKGLEISKVENHELKSELAVAKGDIESLKSMRFDDAVKLDQLQGIREALEKRVEFLSQWFPHSCETSCPNNGQCSGCPNYTGKAF